MKDQLISVFACNSIGTSEFIVKLVQLNLTDIYMDMYQTYLYMYL